MLQSLVLKMLTFLESLLSMDFLLYSYLLFFLIEHPFNNLELSQLDQNLFRNFYLSQLLHQYFDLIPFPCIIQMTYLNFFFWKEFFYY